MKPSISNQAANNNALPVSAKRLARKDKSHYAVSDPKAFDKIKDVHDGIDVDIEAPEGSEFGDSSDEYDVDDEGMGRTNPQDVNISNAVAASDGQSDQSKEEDDEAAAYQKTAE